MDRHHLPRREFLRLMGAVLAGTLSGSLFGCARRDGPAPAGSGGTPGSGAARSAASDRKGGEDQPVRIGYLPITDAGPLLVAHAKGFYKAEGLTAEQPVLFRSWSQIVEAFQARQVNVIHLLMPAAFWLRYARRQRVRVVAWNHVDGSALTVLGSVSRLQDLGGHTVAVPFWYSIHNVVVQMLLRSAGLEPVLGAEPARLEPHQVRLVVMAPSDMPPALAARRIAGFIVAEPFNALAEIQKAGKIFRFTGDVWKEHACCVVLMHETDLEERRAWAEAVVRAIVKAQKWMREHRAEAAEVLAKEGGGYTPHSLEVLRRVLVDADPAAYVGRGVVRHPEWKARRIDFQPYPYPSYTEALVRHIKATRVEGDTRFLRDLDPAFVVRDLVEYELVRRAVTEVGGPGAFAQPKEWQREERIAP